MAASLEVIIGLITIASAIGTVFLVVFKLGKRVASFEQTTKQQKEDLQKVDEKFSNIELEFLKEKERNKENYIKLDTKIDLSFEKTNDKIEESIDRVRKELTEQITKFAEALDRQSDIFHQDLEKFNEKLISVKEELSTVTKDTTEIKSDVSHLKEDVKDLKSEMKSMYKKED